MRRLALLIVALAALPASAQAASISYIGADGNAYLTTPDGARTVQLTRDAAAASKYKMAGQADDGTIVVYKEKHFIWLNPNGTIANGPWRIVEGTYGGLGAISAHVSPEGTLVAYGTFDFNSGLVGGTSRVVLMPKGPLVSQCAFGCSDNMVRPRWVPGALAGFIDEGLNVVSVQVPSVGTQEWFTAPGYKISSFDVSRTGRILIEAFPDSGGTTPKSLALLQSTGLPPNTPTLICELANFSTAGGYPHWSPDGSQIAWEAPDGVYVSPAPVNQGGTCVLQPRLIAPGGSGPDWGVKDVPASPPPPCTTCEPPPCTTCDGPKPFKVTLNPGGRLPKLAAALRRGLVFSVDTPRPGRVLVQLLAAKKLVARGSKTAASAGTVKVKVRFTKKAKRRYRALRKLKLSARATVTDSAGTRATSTRKLVLKR